MSAAFPAGSGNLLMKGTSSSARTHSGQGLAQDEARMGGTITRALIEDLLHVGAARIANDLGGSERARPHSMRPWNQPKYAPAATASAAFESEGLIRKCATVQCCASCRPGAHHRGADIGTE